MTNTDKLVRLYQVREALKRTVRKETSSPLDIDKLDKLMRSIGEPYLERE
jgi:hypothetical protein